MMNSVALKDAFALFTAETERLERAYLLANQKLAALQESSQLLFSHLPDGVLLISTDGTITLINRAALTLLGKKEVEVNEGIFWQHFEDTLFGFSMRESLLSMTETKELILTLQMDQKELTLDVRTWPIAGKGLLLLLRDRTQIKRLEEIASQNDRLKELGQMAATLAHEIRNPLGGIEGFTALLIRDLSSSPEQLKMATHILEGVKSLNGLVHSILDYTRPISLHLCRIELSAYIKNCLTLLTKMDQKRCLFNAECDSLYVDADPQHLKRALLNLVYNALEASEKKEKITLTLSSNKKLIVEDWGKGIPTENMNKIFMPFFTTKAQGSGLGLSEVAKILKAHGFKIEITSKNPGTSCTIDFDSKEEF